MPAAAPRTRHAVRPLSSARELLDSQASRHARCRSNCSATATVSGFRGPKLPANIPSCDHHYQHPTFRNRSRWCHMHGCVAAMCREHPLETKRRNNISIKAKSPHVAAIHHHYLNHHRHHQHLDRRHHDMISAVVIIVITKLLFERHEP